MGRKHAVDEDYLAAVAEDLRDAGCDEDFIEAMLDELRDGETVVVEVRG